MFGACQFRGCQADTGSQHNEAAHADNNDVIEGSANQYWGHCIVFVSDPQKMSSRLKQIFIPRTKLLFH